MNWRTGSSTQRSLSHSCRRISSRWSRTICRPSTHGGNICTITEYGRTSLCLFIHILDRLTTRFDGASLMIAPGNARTNFTLDCSPNSAIFRNSALCHWRNWNLAERMKAEGLPQHVLMTADTVGGVWTYCMELCRELASHGVRVSLATMGAPLRFDQQEQAANIPKLTIYESSYRLEWMDDPWEDVERAGEW